MAVTDENLGEIGESLKQIANALGVVAVNMEAMRDKGKGDQTYLLHMLGYDNGQIAAIIGSTSGSVSKMISNLKKAEKDKKEAKQQNKAGQK